MPYDPVAIEAVCTACEAFVAACDDPALDPAMIDPALKALEDAMEALQGEAEDEGMDMSKMDMAAKSPEDKATLKAKLAKAAFGG
jgi:hypothetical protein